MGIVNINGIDYSGNVVVGTYSINSNDIYSSWTDANAIAHRQIIRKKVLGSFEMAFRNMSEYQNFVNHIETSKTAGGWVPCYLFVNNLATDKSCKLFIKYTPLLGRQNNSRNYVPKFTVEVEET